MKTKKLSSAIYVLLIIVMSVFPVKVNADWWQRPEEEISRYPLPTHREEQTPTEVPSNPSPTSQTASPTQKPGISPKPTSLTNPSPTGSGGIGGTENSDDSDDPCAAGKSYTGPYCGWSPGIEDPASPKKEEVVNALSSVKGLSKTSGPELTLSDIMLFTGALCLSLYAKSKISPAGKRGKSQTV